MTLVLRLTFLASLTSMAGLAANWSGTLVDSDCYASQQRNMKQGTHPASVDNNRAIRACTATAKTKSFAVVQQDGTSLNLDADGNQKASDFVAKEGKMSRYKVNVMGDMNQNMIKVDSISIAK